MPQTFVPAVTRASAIMDLIAKDGALRLAEIAKALALPKSSVHGLLQTLCHLGLLHQNGEGFVIGAKALSWAQGFEQQSVLTQAFHQALADRPALAPYTVTLSVREGADVLYIACRNADAPLGLTFRAGMRLPAIYTATGKAILAHLSPAGLTEVTAHWPAPFTPHSIGDAGALTAQLAEVRAAKIGIDEGELREGMICLGAAILSPSGEAVGGVALSMTAAECPPETRETHASALRDLAGAIRARVFGS